MGATQLRTPKPPLNAPIDLLVRVLDAAQVLAETILIELLPRLRVPQPARVRRDLVAEIELAAVASELELEVDEEQTLPHEERAQHLVDPERHPLEPGHFLRRGELHHAHV